MYAENAIMAKVKALYGKRLTEEDYQQLLQKKSVAEIAAYLKQETAYATSLQEVREDLVHRGQLENLVRHHTADIYERLLKYDFGGSVFPRLYTIWNEVNQLLAALRLLGAGNMDRFIATFPLYLNKYLSFDLVALAHIKTYDDLLDTVRHSDYYKILGEYRPVGKNPINILGCEASLLTYYYRTAVGLFRSGYRKKARQDVIALMRMQIDLHNLLLIYRLKRAFHYEESAIRRYVIPLKSNLSPAFYDDLLQSEDADAMLTILHQTRFLGRIPDWDADTLELATRTLQQQLSHKIFRFTNYPVVVLFSYMTLLEIEEENLVNIIEGIRYALSPDEIRKLLIIK